TRRDEVLDEMLEQVRLVVRKTAPSTGGAQQALLAGQQLVMRQRRGVGLQQAVGPLLGVHADPVGERHEGALGERGAAPPGRIGNRVVIAARDGGPVTARAAAAPADQTSSIIRRILRLASASRSAACPSASERNAPA